MIILYSYILIYYKNRNKPATVKPATAETLYLTQQYSSILNSYHCSYNLLTIININGV